MDGTILGQGTFTASTNGQTNPNSGSASIGQSTPTIVQIPSGADWMSVRNFTKSGAAGSSGAYFNGTANAYVGIEFYWQRGMAAGTGIVRYYGNTTQVVSGDTLVSGGFSLWDQSGQTPGAIPVIGANVAVSAVTNATRPAVTHTADTTIVVGSVVRLNNTAQTDVNGIDMVVGTVTDSTHFTLLTATNALATAPGAIGGAGNYRVINADSPFYPRWRYVTKITQAVNAQVSTSVAHGLTVGQQVRFNIPAQSGMTQLNPTSGNLYEPCTVMSIVDSYNFTINIDTSGFSAFTWPTIAQQPSSFPQVIPFGENTGVSLTSATAQVPLDWNGNPVNGAQSGILADATTNTMFLGMLLGAGGNGLALTTPILGPAGSISWSAGNVATPDTMYWVVGKSSYGGQ